MSKPGLSFFIDGAEVSVEEIGQWVAGHVFACVSESQQELLAGDISWGIMTCVGRKVVMTKAINDRRGWERRNPPNHGGYYYCHICGGWVHRTQAELDHVKPKSVLRGQNPNSDDNRRMAHSWPVTLPDGTVVCVGNQGKGSSIVESKTMDIAPSDEEL